jgi:hypothetical protein
MNFAQVLKYNPNHDPATGRFASSGGGRQGGTYGAPTEDAFGRPIKGLPPKKPVFSTEALPGKAKPQYEGAPGMYERPASPARPGEDVHEYALREAEEYDKGLEEAYATYEKYKTMFGRPPEQTPPRPHRTISGQYRPVDIQSTTAANSASNESAYQPATLNTYVTNKTLAKIPGETANQYVDRQIALGKIRKQRRVGLT